jgi:branched-chain amino acid transport system substrate-binding protein
MFRSTTSRRAIVALFAATAGLGLSSCGSDDKDTASSGSDTSSSAECKPATIAFFGPKTGDAANLGLNIVGGVKVAVDKFNAEHPDCKVTTKDFDSQGDPEKATPLAAQVINDKSIIGVVGPTFSGESDATGPAFAEAGLVTVSSSATNPDLTSNGWKTFHRILGNDATQSPAAAKYIKDNLKSKKAFVVDDASEYGKGIADGVAKDLGDLVVGTDTVQVKQTDFGPTVTKIKASGADALWYGGYYAEAGLLAKQLRAAGWKGYFVSGDGSNDPGFVEAAGKAAAKDARLTCPCGAATPEFTADYEKANPGKKPGTYSAEGFDAATILLDGIGEGKSTRSELLDYVNAYDKPGLTKQLKFDDKGEVAEVVIYAFKVDDKGDIVLDTEIK